MRWFTLVTLLLTGCVCDSGVKQPVDSPEREETARTGDIAAHEECPNVLIIGDSISMGYTPHVKALLKGKVNVSRARGNCGDTRNGLRRLEDWLGDTEWQVIHFNWGLHDLCYRHPDSKVYGHRDKIKGRIAVPLDAYEKNLEELVQRLKQAGAVLIWASTTVVPEGEAGRFVGDDEKYNEAAAAVMKKHGIAIDDLHALTRGFDPSLFVSPGDVHYTKEGYEKLGGQVAQTIEESLRKARAAQAGTKKTAR